jgi:hypothetical protein
MRVILAALTALILAGPAVAQQPPAGFTPREESPEDYPERAGRDETFYMCTGCHGFRIVAQQGQSRRGWEATLDWMTERHGMAKLDAATRTIVLDYLEAVYPPRTRPGGFQNPFAPK